MRQQFEEQGKHFYQWKQQFAADTRRLNWLEEQNGCLRWDAEDEASLPHAAVFLPTIENGQSRFRLAGQGDSFREAIDAAMEASK